jgi:hypothetical protein
VNNLIFLSLLAHSNIWTAPLQNRHPARVFRNQMLAKRTPKPGLAGRRNAESWTGENWQRETFLELTSDSTAGGEAMSAPAQRPTSYPYPKSPATARTRSF